MKRLLCLLGVSAMIGLASPAYADPDDLSGDDPGFLAALRQVGIDYTDSPHAISSGKEVCTLLDGGESGLELLHDLKTHNPGFDLEEASNFAMISAKFYCPQQLTKA